MRVRFDYDERRRGLGDTMPRTTAEQIVATLRGAIPAAARVPISKKAAPPKPAPANIDPPAETTARPLSRVSMLALIVANLVPLFGVLFGGWKLEEVMVLFWAESAVIGCYTLLKMAVVGKWWATLTGMFFVGHFGGFMAVHFLLIYEMFVRGINARGTGPGAAGALSEPRYFVRAEFPRPARVPAHDGVETDGRAVRAHRDDAVHAHFRRLGGDVAEQPLARAGAADRAQGGRRSACTLRRTRGEEAITARTGRDQALGLRADLGDWLTRRFCSVRPVILHALPA